METKRQMESIGSDVNKAIAAGLEALGVTRDQVQVEELDKGSRGLLGIGSRQARVRLTVKSSAAAPLVVQRPSSVPTSLEDVRKGEPPAAQRPSVPREEKPAPPPAAEVVKAPVEKTAPVEPDVEAEEGFEDVASVACQTLEELLEKMGIPAQVEHYVKPPQEDDDYAKLVLNVCGQDLGALIGRRGETLDALQYLTRLIVGREIERRVNLIVDVEGYRARRERSLQQLAQRMAERAVATNRRQTLEPMSPSERRLVHVALRHHPHVKTESVGQGDSRKVTIFVAKDKK